MARCDVCFRHCEIAEGSVGFCGARVCRDGAVIPDNYGRMTSLALDPIEKKPLNRFHSGSYVLSIGSYGCNLRCPFCQNSGISWSEEAFACRDRCDKYSPEEIAGAAYNCRSKGNIGLAFTYNEPLIGYEFVRDTAKLVHDRGMVNVLVTNGTAELHILRELLPYIDAMNIDLKGFTEHWYRDILKGSLTQVKEFIAEAAKHCHVELTTLIIPGENDTEAEMREITGFIGGLDNGSRIPLHISRFFPRFHMTDRQATDVGLIYRLADVARERLEYVYTGNC